jgi:hypothetical protein
MIFLIEYNRSEGRIVTVRTFDCSQRQEAENSRLQLELDLKREGVDNEVVLLEAENEDALRKTHDRYFEDLRGLLSKNRKMPELAAVSTFGGGLDGNTVPAR